MRRYRTQASPGRGGPDEVVVGLEALGTSPLPAVETARGFVSLLFVEGEAFLLKELAMAAHAVGGALTETVLVDPVHNHVQNEKKGTYLI